MDGVTVSPNYASDNIDLSTQTTTCGAHNFYSSNRTIEFVVSRIPGCIVVLKTTSVVKANFRIEASLSDFLADDGISTFSTNIASSLGIDESRITITDIYEGSVVIDFTISSNLSDDAEKSDTKSELNDIANLLTDSATLSSLSSAGYPVLEISTEVIAVTPVSSSNPDDETHTVDLSFQINLVVGVVLSFLILFVIFTAIFYLMERSRSIKEI